MDLRAIAPPYQDNLGHSVHILTVTPALAKLLREEPTLKDNAAIQGLDGSRQIVFLPRSRGPQTVHTPEVLQQQIQAGVVSYHARTPVDSALRDDFSHPAFESPGRAFFLCAQVMIYYKADVTNKQRARAAVHYMLTHPLEESASPFARLVLRTRDELFESEGFENWTLRELAHQITEEMSAGEMMDIYNDAFEDEVERVFEDMDLHKNYTLEFGHDTYGAKFARLTHVASGDSRDCFCGDDAGMYAYSVMIRERLADAIKEFGAGESGQPGLAQGPR